MWILEQRAGGVSDTSAALSIGGPLSWLLTNTTHWAHEKTEKLNFKNWFLIKYRFERTVSILEIVIRT